MTVQGSALCAPGAAARRRNGRFRRGGAALALVAFLGRAGAPNLAKEPLTDPTGSAIREAIEAETPSSPVAVGGAPQWPEDLGRLEPEERDRLLLLLDRTLAVRSSEGPRAANVRLARGLLLLEPLPGRDPAKARQELTAASTEKEGGAGSLSARYALAWIDEVSGRGSIARDALQRLVVERPESGAASRAAGSIGRILLREGDAAAAAWWLQRAVERGGNSGSGAADLREAAVRRFLARAGAGKLLDPATTRVFPTGARAPSALVRAGRFVYVADRKDGVVLRLAKDGDSPQRWSVPNPQALAADAFGRVFAAAESGILKLRADGTTSRVASIEPWPAVGGMAVDVAGRFWVTDRRGSRVGIIEPGSQSPRIVRDRPGERVSALAGDDDGVLVVEQRSGRIERLRADGTESTVAQTVPRAAVDLAAGPGGQIVVLLDSGSRVVLLDAGGFPLEQIETRLLGLDRAAALSVGADGSLDLLDQDTKRVVCVP